MIKGKRMLAAAAIGIVGVMALSGCGGAPSELVVKGLRLGVPVEEAARVMVEHGVEIGGKADPGWNEWALREYEEAAVEHAAGYIRRVCAERGFTDFGAYVKFAAAESGAPPAAAETLLSPEFTEEENALYGQAIFDQMARFVRAEAERIGAETWADYILLTVPPEQFRQEAFGPRPSDLIRSDYNFRIAEEGQAERGLMKWINEGFERFDVDVPTQPEGESPPDILEVVAERAPEGTLSLANLEESEILNWAASNGVDGWSDVKSTGIDLIPEVERFPDLDTFVTERYPDGRPYHLGGPWDGKTALELEYVPSYGGTGLLGDGINWWLRVDDQRRVTEMQLMAPALETLFGAGDMSTEEFAATFANSYDVPLEFYADAVPPELINLAGTAFRTGWLYVNRDAGWSVSINEHKMLTIKAVTPASEQAFD